MTHPIRDEVVPLFQPIAEAARRRGPLAFPMTACCGTVIVLLAWLYRLPNDHVYIRHHIFEYAGLSWMAALVRLLPSLFAPATALPFWGSVLQVVATVAACEVMIGRRATVVVGLLGHGVATLSARIFIWLGGSFVGGLGIHYLNQSDSGPSAAVTALAVYLAVTRRFHLLLVAMLTWPLLEAVVHPGLAEREHVVALLTGLVCAGAHRLGQTARETRERRSSQRRARPVAPRPAASTRS